MRTTFYLASEMKMWGVSLFVFALGCASALDNGLGARPPLGWNSWNLAGCSINETFFRQTVRALAAKGFREAGYEYVNLDDCWMSTERDANGDLQWDPVAFPTGSTLGSFVHDMGFKFGMYLSSGPKTCSLNTCSHAVDATACVVNRSATGWGSYSADGSVEARDAMWIAKQGADYLKYDAVCGGDFGAPPLNASFGILQWEQHVVSKMGTALNATGRQIWYQYGNPYVWNAHGRGYAGALQFLTQNASLGGVNSYRAGFDMGDSWGLAKMSVNGAADFNLGLGQPYEGCSGGACPWPDADCLEIGNNLTDINPLQAQSYFSWYALANMPLILSTRIDTLDDRLLPILLNEEVIAIQQDSTGNVLRRGLPISGRLSSAGRVWGRPLSNRFKYFANSSDIFEPMRPPPGCGGSDCGSVAFLVPNDSDQPCNSTVLFTDLGYSPVQQAMVRDAVAQKDVGVFTGSFTALLHKDESMLLIITPGKKL